MTWLDFAGCHKVPDSRELFEQGGEIEKYRGEEEQRNSGKLRLIPGIDPHPNQTCCARNRGIQMHLPRKSVRKGFQQNIKHLIPSTNQIFAFRPNS
jgi:hypothetical protein